MRKFQHFRAKHLMAQAKPGGKCLGFLASILGISQNGKANIGAVHPQLVGSAGDRSKRQLAPAIPRFQQLPPGQRGLPFRVDIPQKAGQFPAGNGGIDNAAVPFRSAVDQGMIGFFAPFS